MKAFIGLRSHLRREARVLGLAAGAAFALACSGPADNQIFTLTLPDQATFPAVSGPLEIRCGTLDCHGSAARNMRLYGHYGLRLTKDLVNGIDETKPEEWDANYESVVTIEPEKLSAIVSHNGQGIDHWIVVTKGTGAEHHKGGSRFAKGDATYTCILSWLQKNVNMDACTEAANVVSPFKAQPPASGNQP